MEHSIIELVSISAMFMGSSAMTIVTLGSMIVASIMLLFSLVSFYRAHQTKARSAYSKAFRLSGNGFLVLGFLQAFLLGYLDAAHKGNAIAAAIFFIVIGAAASFIGEKLKTKPDDRK